MSEKDKVIKKRANGEGSWRKRKNAKGEEYYEYRASFGEDLNGEIIRKSFYGKKQKDCLNQAKEFKDGLDAKIIAVEEYTLAQWLDKWMQVYKKGSVSDGTYDNYVYCIGIIKEHSVAKMLLTKIKPIHVTQFYKDKAEYSSSVLNKFSILLYGAFEAAIDNDLCYKNPAKRAVKIKKAPGEKTPFSPEETASIKEFAMKDSEFGLVMLIMLGTGLRPQEIRALHWKRIDLKENYILVDSAVKRNGVIGLPKGNRSRIVPITDELADLLKSHAGDPDTPVFTFPDESKRKRRAGEGLEADGIHLTENSLRWQYNDFLARLNKYLAENEKPTVRVLSPHSTRHTYATELGIAGVPQKAIQLLLGHADMSTTDGYTHLSELGYLRNAIQGK